MYRYLFFIVLILLFVVPWNPVFSQPGEERSRRGGGFPGGGFPGGGGPMSGRSFPGGGGFSGGGFPGGGQIPGSGFPGGGFPGRFPGGGFPGGGFPGGGFSRDMMRGGPTSGGFPWRNEDRQRQSSQTTATTTDPLVPGFGESTVQPLVPAFGQRVQTVTSFTATSGSISSASDSQRKIDDAAQKMMERYDKDQNNLIEKSTNEWAELKIDSNQIDLNRNNVITLDEIKRYLTNQEKGLKPEQTVGKIFTTYTTTYEHLPEGVPSWFLDRDKDNDGQLTLIEFANDQPITKAVIGEFEGFLDLNNDGILTVEECYQALKAEEEAKQKAKQAEQVKSTGRSDPGRGDRGDRGDRGGRRGNSGGDRPRGGDRDQPWQPGSGSEQQQNSSS